MVKRKSEAKHGRIIVERGGGKNPFKLPLYKKTGSIPLARITSYMKKRRPHVP